MSASDDLRNAQFLPPLTHAEKLEAVARDLAAANGTTTADELAKAHALPTFDEVTLQARRYGASMKVSREWQQSARFSQAQDGDDFLRDQLTVKLEAAIYGEKADVTSHQVHALLEGSGEATLSVTKVEPVHEVERPARVVGLLALCMMASLPLPWSLLAVAVLLLAIVASNRWGERRVPDVIKVPYEHSEWVPVWVRRETWAMYPDAPLPVRPPDQFGKPVTVLQFDAVQNRDAS